VKIKKGSLLDRIRLPFTRKRMKNRDKELLIESLILVVIYSISFVILSLGRVQQKFFNMSESTFSNIQIIALTFIFAVIITIVIYFVYRKAIK